MGVWGLKLDIQKFAVLNRDDGRFHKVAFSRSIIITINAVIYFYHILTYKIANERGATFDVGLAANRQRPRARMAVVAGAEIKVLNLRGCYPYPRFTLAYKYMARSIK